MRKKFIEPIIATIWIIGAAAFAWLLVHFNKTYGDGWQTALIILIGILSIPLLIVFSGYLRSFGESPKVQSSKIPESLSQNNVKAVVWHIKPSIPFYNVKPSTASPCEYNEKTAYEWKENENVEIFKVKEQLSATLC